MQRLVTPVLGLMVACVASTVLAGGVVSGLEEGDAPGAFNVKDVTGPRQGESLCYK